MQPIVVRPVANGYELIAGHRRLEAARLLGWTEIAVIVREENADEAYILTLVENLQREDLSPKEEASALEVLVRERGWTTRQVGEAIKRSHVYVSRRLRVFEDDVLAPMVLSRGLTVSTAEELLRAPDPETRKELAGQAAEHQWTWGEARRAIADLGTDRSKWAGVAAHLRAIVDGLPEVDLDSLTAADRKLVRRTLTALRRLV
jgi:ParB family chromosome partitioning protein